jgi:hypothetical protein
MAKTIQPDPDLQQDPGGRADRPGARQYSRPRIPRDPTRLAQVLLEAVEGVPEAAAGGPERHVIV